MTVPPDLDDAYVLFKQKAADLDAALDAVAAEQATGRSGLALYKRAEALSQELNQFGRVLGERIEEALRAL